jgi:hypothetical protein
MGPNKLTGSETIAQMAEALRAGNVEAALALLDVDNATLGVLASDARYVGKAGGDRRWRDRLVAGRA